MSCSMLWCYTAIKVIAGCHGYSIPSWDDCRSVRIKWKFSATIKLIAPDRLLSGESHTIPTACTVKSKTMAVVQVSAPPLTQQLCSRLCLIVGYFFLVNAFNRLNHWMYAFDMLDPSFMSLSLRRSLFWRVPRVLRGPKRLGWLEMRTDFIDTNSMC